MSDPLVSVVMATVRLDEFFVSAVWSVLRQTHQNLELVVVLDGIPLAAVDGSDWASDSRLVVVPLQARVGTPTALNHGIRVSRGRYIARLDADDIAYDTRIASQVAIMESCPELLCLGGAVALIDELGRSIGGLSASAEEDVPNALLIRNVMVHSSVMYRRAAWLEIGGYNPLCLRMQDYELFLRIAAVGAIRNSADIQTAYRIHAGQHSRHSSPWALHMREILRRRLALAEVLGQSKVRQRFRNVQWFSYQVMRHYGVVRPRYLRGVSHVV